MWGKKKQNLRDKLKACSPSHLHTSGQSLHEMSMIVGLFQKVAGIVGHSHSKFNVGRGCWEVLSDAVWQAPRLKETVPQDRCYTDVSDHKQCFERWKLLKTLLWKQLRSKITRCQLITGNTDAARELRSVLCVRQTISNDLGCLGRLIIRPICYFIFTHWNIIPFSILSVTDIYIFQSVKWRKKLKAN